MSIKVLEVPGRNLTAATTSQDFILNSHPVMGLNECLHVGALYGGDIAGQALGILDKPEAVVAAVLGYRSRSL